MIGQASTRVAGSSTRLTAMHGWRRSPDSRSKKAGEAGIEVQACTYSFFMLIHGADPANNTAKHALRPGVQKGE
ncbi:MAG: hypothetical protein OCU17_02230 [Methanophagales archaeon]|nr:hypothetical protein [Methanophagales archaeon]